MGEKKIKGELGCNDLLNKRLVKYLSRRISLSTIRISSQGGHPGGESKA